MHFSQLATNASVDSGLSQK